MGDVWGKFPPVTREAKAAALQVVYDGFEPGWTADQQARCIAEAIDRETETLRSEVRRLQATHHDAAVIYGQVRAEAEAAEAEVAALREENARFRCPTTAPDMWCLSCGSVTRDGDCHCTENGPEAQNLVNYGDHLCAIARAAEARAAAVESLLSEIRHIVEAERQAFGPSAFSTALWETLTADDAATALAEPAGAVQGGGAVSGEVGAAKSDTQTFARPMTWTGLGKD